MKLKKYLIAATVLIAGLLALPESLHAETADVSNYTVNGTTVTVNTSSGDAWAGQRIEAALDYAKVNATDTAPITVKVPSGDYTFNHTKAAMYTASGLPGNYVFRGLHIYSNTLLDASGCTFRIPDGDSYLEQFVQFGNLSSTGSVISYNGTYNYNRSPACAGYGGFRNIGIYGGTWVGSSSNTHTLFKMYHASNVELRNVTVAGGGAKHQLEMAAMDNVRITNCTFRDYTPKSATAANEAVQLDVPANRNLIVTGYEDGTPSQNITVTGCTFSNVPGGFGTHSLLVGAYHRNVYINDNIFTDISGSAIAALCYENLQIQNNRISGGTGTGIYVGSFISPASGGVTDTICMNTGIGNYNNTPSYNGTVLIANNTVSVRSRGAAIAAMGYNVSAGKSLESANIPVGNYYLNNVTVQNNTISTGGQGILISDVANANISSNRITGKGSLSGYYGILAKTGSAVAKITDNKIVNMGGSNEGIYISDSLVDGDISGNKIARNSGSEYSCKHAIAVVGNSAVKGNIYGNTITKPSQNGVIIYSGATCSSISSNKITSSRKYAIRISSAATNGVVIANNSLLKCEDRGISISGAKTDEAITVMNNKLTSVNEDGSGIYVAKCRSRVSGNRMTGWKYGIVAATGSTGEIFANRYSGTKTHIYLKGEKKYYFKQPNLTGLSVSGGSGSLTVSYDKPVFKSVNGGKNLPAKHYKVTCATDKKFTQNGKVVDTDDLSTTIGGLPGGTKYYVTVQGYRKINGINIYTNIADIKKATTK